MYRGCLPLTNSTRDSIFVHRESQVPGRHEIGSCLERTHSYFPVRPLLSSCNKTGA